MERLKNCPFCGGEVYKIHGFVTDPALLFKCKNPHCRAYMTFYNAGAIHNEGKAI